MKERHQNLQPFKANLHQTQPPLKKDPHFIQQAQYFLQDGLLKKDAEGKTAMDTLIVELTSVMPRGKKRTDRDKSFLSAADELQKLLADGLDNKAIDVNAIRAKFARLYEGKATNTPAAKKIIDALLDNADYHITELRDLVTKERPLYAHEVKETSRSNAKDGVFKMDDTLAKTHVSRYEGNILVHGNSWKRKPDDEKAKFEARLAAAMGTSYKGIGG